jgi:hypothetical protein
MSALMRSPMPSETAIWLNWHDSAKAGSFPDPAVEQQKGESNDLSELWKLQEMLLYLG